jgi:hypothetical protein
MKLGRTFRKLPWSHSIFQMTELAEADVKAEWTLEASMKPPQLGMADPPLAGS